MVGDDDDDDDDDDHHHHNDDDYDKCHRILGNCSIGNSFCKMFYIIILKHGKQM